MLGIGMLGPPIGIDSPNPPHRTHLPAANCLRGPASGGGSKRGVPRTRGPSLRRRSGVREARPHRPGSLGSIEPGREIRSLRKYKYRNFKTFTRNNNIKSVFDLINHYENIA